MSIRGRPEAAAPQLDELGNVVSVSGQLASFGVDLAPYYCPESQEGSPSSR